MYSSLGLVTYHILLSVLLHIVSFSQSCYRSYPSLSLVTYRILISVLLHIVSFSQFQLHVISFSQSCYILYPSLSLVTHRIFLSVLLHIVSISSLRFTFLCCMKEWPVKNNNHGFFQMRRISSASCAQHLRVTMCLVIFITGSTSSSATSSAGRRPGRLTMVNASSVLWHFHLMVQRHLLGPSSLHRSVNTSLSFVLHQSLGVLWPIGIFLVLDHFIDHWTPHYPLSVVLKHLRALAHLKIIEHFIVHQTPPCLWSSLSII